jgi:hypothetical protein
MDHWEAVVVVAAMDVQVLQVVVAADKVVLVATVVAED